MATKKNNSPATPPSHNIIAYGAEGEIMHCGWARVAIDKNGYPYLKIELRQMPRGGKLYAHLTKAQKDAMQKPEPEPPRARRKSSKVA